jgi:hypothetical protein
VLKVLAHLGCEDHVNDNRPQRSVLISVQVFENVSFVALIGELEGERRMMILQHGSLFLGNNDQFIR